MERLRNTYAECPLNFNTTGYSRIWANSNNRKGKENLPIKKKTFFLYVINRAQKEKVNLTEKIV